MSGGRLQLPSDFSSLATDWRRSDEITAELETYLCDFKRYRNELLPISRVPDEILVEVFRKLLYLHDTPASLANHSYYNSPYRVDFEGAHQSLISVSRVCRRWRRVATGTGSLWTQIFLTNDVRLAAYLERSAGAMLTFGLVHNRRLSYMKTKDFHMVFKDLADRVRAAYHVRIDGPANKFFSTTFAQDRLCLPHAEALDISFEEVVNAAPALAQLDMPRLKILLCESVPHSLIFRWAQPTLTRLHALGISRAVSIADWRDLLSGLPKLEELHLEANLTLEQPHAQTTLGDRVGLPKLCQVKLIDGSSRNHATVPASFAYLLNSFSCSSEADVTLEAHSAADWLAWLDSCEFFLSTIPHVFPEPIMCAASQPRALRITFIHHNKPLFTLETSSSDTEVAAAPCTLRATVRLPSEFDCAPRDGWQRLFAMAKAFCNSQMPHTLTVFGEQHGTKWKRLRTARFLDAHTLVLSSWFDRAATEMLEALARSSADFALPALRRLQLGILRSVYGGSTHERRYHYRILDALEELQEKGSGLEMLNLGTGWVSVTEAIANNGDGQYVDEHGDYISSGSDTAQSAS